VGIPREGTRPSPGLRFRLILHRPLPLRVCRTVLKLRKKRIKFGQEPLKLRQQGDPNNLPVSDINIEIRLEM
jgi:hypothetical protein